MIALDRLEARSDSARVPAPRAVVRSLATRERSDPGSYPSVSFVFQTPLRCFTSALDAQHELALRSGISNIEMPTADVHAFGDLDGSHSIPGREDKSRAELVGTRVEPKPPAELIVFGQ